jgi:NagD protein
MEALRAKKGFICDMDGVIYHGNVLLRASRNLFNGFIRRIKIPVLPTAAASHQRSFSRSSSVGLDVDESTITPRPCNSKFLSRQKPGCSAM